ncbi:NADH dehydrogenase [ubiquinone] 1 beta subcomplex subunit 4-like [Achroia grisella]|uniref:NADH dehydrogenase [ubiquinone] 1 beta subcomplex subunit 4-like n=1 Tax=Achroia grisella TaxID=688607 RepID=UPI0027D33728|nr:NADH dehydrogenase [ubiquinone] 1 beta subcomplex subunit 4-like [Achroia grisella]
MANNYGLSDAEFNLIKQQASRRAELRKEFIKQRTNPWKHASESGYVFDPALQKFISMKVTQFDNFTPNPRTSLFGFCAIIIPMVSYGYLIWNDRNKQEQKIRSGELRYRERKFKFA